MTKKEKIEQLRGEIERLVRPLIGGDYVLLDLPYYANIGDTLIWEGEAHFLRRSPYRMLGYGSMTTWTFPKLDKDTTILLCGGGNFGNIWHGSQQFRLEVIERYPCNPIVIFPQTVYYDNIEAAVGDAFIAARHPNLTICARDNMSFRFFKEYFPCRILLVPDMAFCIPAREIEYSGNKSYPGRTLVIERQDKEAGARTAGSCSFAGDADVRDWPTMEKTTLATKLMYKTSGVSKYAPLLRRPFAKLADYIAMQYVRPGNICAGVELIGPYDSVCTDRLHGAILAIMMDKREVQIVDNSYGKNSSFYDTWLRDVEGVGMAVKK